MSGTGHADRGGFARRQPGTSAWALAAAVASSAVLCPPLPLLGVFLGLRALGHVRAVPGRRGRGLALAAVVVGLAATAGWTGVAWWWDANVRRPILAGPAEALAAGLAGDVAAFRAGFPTGGGTEGEAAAFLDELGRRYGRWAGLERGRAPGGGSISRGRVACPYELRFERSTVPAVADFVVWRRGSGIVARFERLEVIDAERGPLVYPPR